MNFNYSRSSPRSYFISFFNSQLWRSITNFTLWKVLHYVIMVIFYTCSWITKIKGIPLRPLYLQNWNNLIIWCISDYVYSQKLQKSDIKPTQLCCMENVIKKSVLEPLLRNSPNLERQIYELNIPFKASIPTKLSR